MEKLKLKDLIDGVESINHLMTLKLPITVSYKLGVFIKKMQPDLETYNTERKKLIDELSTPQTDEKGKPTGQVKFETKEKGEEFLKKLEKITNQAIKADVPDIKLADLGSIEIEPKHLVALTWLIKA